MSDQNPLDDLFKHKLNQREFEFNESYWQSAERLIIQDQKQNKRYQLTILTYALSLMTVIAIPLLVLALSSLERHDGSDLMVKTNKAILQPLTQLDHLATSPILTDGNPPISNSETGVVVGSFPPPASEAVHTVEHDTFDEAPLQEAGEKNTFNIKANPVIGRLTMPDHHLEEGIKTGSGPLATSSNFPFRRHFVAFQLGSQFSAGLFNQATDRAEWSLHPVVGIRYAFAVSPKLRIQTALLYQGRAGLNGDLIFEDEYLGFGLETQETLISPRRLHYLEIPLMLEWRIFRRHYLQAGGSLAYLMNINSTVQISRQGPYALQDQQTSRAWGYTQGFNKMDLGLNLAYAYYLGRGIRAGAQAQLGLRDLTDNQVYASQKRDNNLQMRLFVEYDL